MCSHYRRCRPAATAVIASIDFGINSTYEHSHMPKINSSSVKICESSRLLLTQFSPASHPGFINCYPHRSTKKLSKKLKPKYPKIKAPILIVLCSICCPVFLDFAVALSQHVDASSGEIEAFAKVSTEMFFQFPFACATNTSCT
jgi:hypothetical protein